MSVFPMPVPIPVMTNRFIGADSQDLSPKPKPAREFHPHCYISADKYGYAPDLGAPSDLKWDSPQTPQPALSERASEPKQDSERSALGWDSRFPKQEDDGLLPATGKTSPGREAAFGPDPTPAATRKRLQWRPGC